MNINYNRLILIVTLGSVNSFTGTLNALFKNCSAKHLPRNPKTNLSAPTPQNSFDERRPFVKNSNDGIWLTACISDDLLLIEEGPHKLFYSLNRMHWTKHPTCPFNIVVHGNISNVLIKEKNMLHALDATAFAKLIKSTPTYKEGHHIHLFSCNSGQHSEGLAQRLADEMKVPVSAFTGLAGTNPFWFASIDFDENYIPSLKEIKTFYPKEPNFLDPRR